MSVSRLPVVVAVLLALGFATPSAGEELGLRVPEGFEVSLFADDALAHDVFSMTIDAQGRVVVAGIDYVKILHDDDHDNRADRATLFSAVPASGAHGMVFDGADLICTGDNAVMRLRDTDGDGVADGPPEIWTELKHSEHGANGLVRGPDGCYYLACGNDAGVSEKQIASARSPVLHPRCGAMVRFTADGRPLDVVAHGFRNPYDLDFDAAGHLLVVDSDGERDHHLPWYAPTRLFDVAAGGEHGWLLQGWPRGWNRPPSFFDNVERMVEIGRGSPTGAVVYRHRQFPAHYRGGLFSACWTLGRVYYFPLQPAGATCRSQLEIFLETTGDVGFAPCDLAVGPAGDLFVAIGGRHTRGSVFRISAKGNHVPENGDRDRLAQVLQADQPLSSWSRAHWLPIAGQLGQAVFEQAVADQSLDVDARVRAVEVLVDVFGGLPASCAECASKSDSAEVRARIAWAMARGDLSPSAKALLARLSADADPRVGRAAWEALASASDIDSASPVQPDWSGALASRVRRVRAAAIAVARRAGRASYSQFVADNSTGPRDPRQCLAKVWIELPEPAIDGQRGLFSEANFATCLQCFDAATSDPELALEAVRLLQIGLGDLRVKSSLAEVYTGYVGNVAEQLDARQRRAIVEQLTAAFPTADAELNRELARLLGMLDAGDDTLLPAVARQWTAESSVEDDVHYLIVASLLKGTRSTDVTAATANCLLGLQPKLEARGQFASRNWPFRLGEVFDELCRRDPRLPGAVVDSPAFGDPDHALFADRLPKTEQPPAARKLWAALALKQQQPNSEAIALVGKLPAEESRPFLLALWDQPALQDAIILTLAKHPRAEDRSKFVAALASPQPGVVEKAAQALVALGIDSKPSEMAAAIRALKQACAIRKQTEPRKSLLLLLDFWTEGSADLDDPPDADRIYLPWFNMFEQYYPAEADRLRASAGADAAGWKTRLAEVDWSTGDATRGRGVFERRACHRCHQVSGHLGPELKGAVSRMSREDLFMAIVDPNLEVAPTFRTTVIATNSGQVYHGLVVYESPEGTLLQTGPDTTVRVTDAEQTSMRTTTRSLMPTGLLDTLSNDELSDLHAYLRSLGAG